MSLQLFVNRDYENNLIYFLNGKYYDATTLTPYQFPEGSSSARLTKLLEWFPEQIEAIPSRPVYVLTHNKWIIFGVQADGSLLVIAQSGPIDDDERVVDATIFKLPDISTEPLSELPRRDFPMNIYERFIFLVNNGMRLTEYNNAIPTIGIQPSDIPQPIAGLPGGSIGLSDRVASGGHVNPFAPVSIRPSSETALSPPGSPVYDGAFSQSSISSPPPVQIQQGLPSVPNAPARLQRMQGASAGVIPFNSVSSGDLRFGEMERDDVWSSHASSAHSLAQSPVKSPSPSSNTLVQQSYETLMKQIYGIPVTLPSSLIINGLASEFININRAGELLSSGQIQNFILDPLLQPWSGPPDSPNRIITLFGKNGITYLVKAQYHPVTGQIYPPT